jgi:hypothetical protein
LGTKGKHGENVSKVVITIYKMEKRNMNEKAT